MAKVSKNKQFQKAKAKNKKQAESIIDTLAKIPSSSNISDQVEDSVNAVSEGIMSSVLSSPELSTRLDTAKNNAAKLKPVLDSVLSMLKIIEEFNKEVGITDIVSMKLGSWKIRMLSFDKLIEFINTVCDKVKDNPNFELMSDKNKNPLNILAECVEGLGTIMSPKNMTLMFAGSKIMKLIDWKIFSKSLHNFANAIMDTFGNKDMLENISLAEKSISQLTSISESLKSMVNNISKTSMMAVASFPVVMLGLKAIKAIMFALNLLVPSMIALISKRVVIKASCHILLSISATFALFALSIYTVSLAVLNPGIWYGLTALGILVTASVALIMILGSRLLRRGIGEGRRNILLMSAAFTLFALSVVILGEAALDEDIWTGFRAFIAMVTAALGVMLALKLMSPIIRGGGLALLAIGGAFTLFALSVIILGEAAEVNRNNVTYVLTLALGSAAILTILSQAKTNILMGAVALGIASISLMGFIGVLVLINEVDIGEGLLAKMGYLAVIVAATAAIYGIAGIGPVFAAIMLGAAALTVAFVSLLAISLMLAGIDSILSGINWETFKGNLASLSNTLDDIIGIGFKGLIATLAVPGLLAITMVTTLLLISTSFINKTLDMLIGIDFGLLHRKLTTGYTTLVEDLISISDRVGFKGFAKLLGLAPIVTVVSDILTSIGNSMKLFDSMYIPSNLSENISKIICTLIDTILDISKKPSVDEIIKGGFGKSRIGLVLDIAKQLGMIIFSLSGGIAGMANLRIAEYNANGKIKGYRQLTEGDFKLAANNISTIVTNIIDSIVELAKQQDVQDMIKGGGFLGLGKSKVAKVLKVVHDVSESISGLANNIVCYATGDFKDPESSNKYIHLDSTQFEAAGTNISNLVTKLVQGFKDAAQDKEIQKILKTGLFGGDSKVSLVLQAAKNISEVMSNMASNVVNYAKNKFMFNGKVEELSTDDYTAAGNNIAKLIKSSIGIFNDINIDNDKFKNVNKAAECIVKVKDAVNDVDLTKLEKMNTLMSTIQKFSEGINYNFQGLADVINGKLVEALEELKETLEDVKGGLGITDKEVAVNMNSGAPEPAQPNSTTPAQVNNEVLNNTIKNIENEIKKLTRTLGMDNAIRVSVTNEPLIVRNQY